MIPIKEDFFSFTDPYLASLNQTERKIFDYVVQNIHTVKDKSIRALSHECYVSTTTMFRFVRKLGFLGFGDFINLLRLTDYSAPSLQISDWVSTNTYLKRYINNIADTLRIASSEKIGHFIEYLTNAQKVILLTDDCCIEIATYARHLFFNLGFLPVLPLQFYELKNILQHVSSNDLILTFSVTEQGKGILNVVERIRAEKHPPIVAITSLNGSMIQNLSDLSFLAFAEPPGHFQTNIPAASMLALMDLLAYSYLQKISNAAIPPEMPTDTSKAEPQSEPKSDSQRKPQD
ncbi:MAG: MurR/RpiR family transcriptional regulator [Lawsonibacter sp.]|nr:MurR/RpiR family transcriptional regulator [Lawsonibacter sp.]